MFIGNGDIINYIFFSFRQREARQKRKLNHHNQEETLDIGNQAHWIYQHRHQIDWIVVSVSVFLFFHQNHVTHVIPPRCYHSPWDWKAPLCLCLIQASALMCHLYQSRQCSSIALLKHF